MSRVLRIPLRVVLLTPVNLSMSRRAKQLLFFVATVFAAGATPASESEALPNIVTLTWRGPVPNATWAAALSWAPNQQPFSNEILIFPDSPQPSRLTLYSIIGVRNFTELRFVGANYQVKPGGATDKVFAQAITGKSTSGETFFSLPFYANMPASVWTIESNAVLMMAAGLTFATTGATVTVTGEGRTAIVGLQSETGTNRRLVKSGTGKLFLSGAATVADVQIDIAGGTVHADFDSFSASGASSVTVQAGGVLRGSGRLGTVACAGQIVPGSDTEFGDLKFSGPLTFSSGALVHFEILSPSSNDRLTTSSSINFSNASPDLVLATLPLGSSATLVSAAATSVIVPFSALPPNALFSDGQQVLRVSYTGGASGKDMTITRVASPTPRLFDLSVPGAQQATFGVSGVPNQLLTIESSSDLTIWTTAGQIRLDQNGNASFSASAVGKAFFRATFTEP